MKTVIAFLFLFISTAHAGWFSSEPPQSFQNSWIKNPYSDHVEYNVTLHQVIKLYEKSPFVLDPKLSWRKVDGVWVVDIEYKQILASGLQRFEQKYYVSMAFINAERSDQVRCVAYTINGQPMDEPTLDIMLRQYYQAVKKFNIPEKG